MRGPQAQLRQFADQGLVVRADGHTTSTIQLRNGAFTFNGRSYVPAVPTPADIAPGRARRAAGRGG